MSGGNNFNHFAENQLTKFSARDAGDFCDEAGEWEMALKCGSLPRDAGDLVGLTVLSRLRRSLLFRMAVSIWWVVLVLMWFLAAGLKWGRVMKRLRATPHE